MNPNRLGSLHFCLTCNARERRIVDGRCTVCAHDPNAETPAVLCKKALEESVEYR